MLHNEWGRRHGLGILGTAWHASALRLCSRTETLLQAGAFQCI